MRLQKARAEVNERGEERRPGFCCEKFFLAGDPTSTFGDGCCRVI